MNALHRQRLLRHYRFRGQGGFSLLEAIVAMVVLAAGLLSLYAWLSSNTIALVRVQANVQGLEDARSALALVETVNPMDTPRGDIDLDGLRVSWNATQIGSRRSGTAGGATGAATVFDLALYNVDVQVLRNDRLVRTFTVRRAGWAAVRSMDTEL